MRRTTKPLDKIYRAENPRTVRALLRKHPRLHDALADAVPHVVASFGNDSEVRLHALRDYGAKQRSLHAVIVTNETDEQRMLLRYDAFDTAWWLSADDDYEHIVRFSAARRVNLDAIS